MFDYKTLQIPFYIKNDIVDGRILNNYKETADKLVETYDNGWGNGWADFCNSWNSLMIDKNLIFSTDLFKEIKEPIINSLKEYFKELGVPSGYNIQIYESWLNATSPYGFQESHTHIGSAVSGCFYISCPKKFGSFYIDNPLEYGLFGNFIPLYNNKKFFDLAAGSLILFPSNVKHGVRQNPTTENRYSISFNARPTKNIWY